MKKNAIIDIIEGDLKEMQTLVSTFRESDTIPQAFIDLLSQKHDGIGRELSLLSYWSEEKQSEPRQKKQEVELVAEVTAPASEASQTDTAEPIAPLSFDETEDDDLFDYEREAAPQTVEQATETEEQPKKVTVVEEPEKKTPEPAPRREPEETQQPKPRAGQRNAADIAKYGNPVTDLNKALTLNDRFLFLRELFGGMKPAMDAAIESINHCQDYASAHKYLTENFDWDETDPNVELFLNAVHRRFI